LGCFSIADAVATTVGGDCNADAVLTVLVPVATQMQN